MVVVVVGIGMAGGVNVHSVELKLHTREKEDEKGACLLGTDMSIPLLKTQSRVQNSNQFWNCQVKRGLGDSSAVNGGKTRLKMYDFTF
jgi:hypothetical protein